jgi:hypothetical protein
MRLQQLRAGPILSQAEGPGGSQPLDEAGRISTKGTVDVAAQVVERLAVTTHKPGIDEGGCVVQIIEERIDALLNRSNGMAQRKSGIPEGVEHALGQLLDSVRAALPMQDHEVHIGAGGQGLPPVTSQRHQ